MLWPWPLIVFVLWFPGEWILGYFFNDYMLNLALITMLFSLGLMLLTVLTGFAYDIQRQTNSQYVPSMRGDLNNNKMERRNGEVRSIPYSVDGNVMWLRPVFYSEEHEPKSQSARRQFAARLLILYANELIQITRLPVHARIANVRPLHALLG
jgi:hypothetical protein